MDDAILSIIGSAFAAFAVWLTVRIINRRERWAIWLAVFVFEAIGLLGSVYCTLFYGWLTATPLSASQRVMAENCAYASVFACAALVTLVLFFHGKSGNQR